MAIFFGECADGLKYSLGGDTLVFDEAQAFCQDIGGSLAVPGSIDRLNRLVNFLIDNGGDSAIVGLRDFGSIRDPSSFIGVDGQVYGFTAVGNFNDFPWGGDIDENCLEISTESGLLEAVSCFSPRNFVCEHFCSTAPSFVFDSCQSDVQLYLNHEFKTYDEALVDCQSVDPTATLAIPESQEKLNQINSFLTGTAFSNSFVYVGVGDFTQNQNLLSFDRFFGADGSASDFIQSDKAWAVNQPDNLGGDQFCAGVNSLLFDDSCQVLKPSLCQRSCSVDVDKEFAFDSCTNNNQFFYNPEALSFEDAAESCESLGGRLAIPSSITKAREIATFKRKFTNGGSHVGLKDFRDVDTFVGDRFVGIDTNPNPATSVNRRFPWGSGQPSNFNNIENCVEVLSVSLNDIPCSELRTSVCERFCDEQPEFVFGECVDEVQYFFNPDLNTFDGARADCHALDAGAELAIPRDEETFRRIQDFYESNRTTGVDAFIGLADFVDFGGSFVTRRFRSPDGELLRFTSGTSNLFPWGLNEPDDGSGNENCVSLSSEDSLLQDTACVQELSSICERPCGLPDPLPTQFPTVGSGIIEGECIDDIKYFLIPELTTFFGADVDCKTVDSTAQVAQPKTLERFSQMVDFYNENDLTLFPAFLGYTDILGVGGGGNTGRFLSFDGQQIPFISGDPGRFPWQIGQPNDSIGGEDCVRIDESSLLVDTTCFGFVSVMCEVFCGDPGPPPPPYEECVDGIQYFITPATGTIENGLTQCELFDERAKLAEPKSLQELERLQTFYIANRSSVISAFLGLKHERVEAVQFAQREEPVNITTANGDPVPFVSVPRREFPWDFSQPTGDDCTAMGPNGLLIDEECNRRLFALCELNCGPPPTLGPIPAPELIEGDCSDGIQYLFNAELNTFDVALASCKAFNEKASLAVPRNDNTFFHIGDFFYEQASSFRDLSWLGLRNLQPRRDAVADTATFTEVDGSTNDFTSNTRGFFPWEFNEPDNTEGEDHCVVFRGISGELADSNCFQELISICEVPCSNEDDDAQFIVVASASGIVTLCLCALTILLCLKCCNCSKKERNDSENGKKAAENVENVVEVSNEQRRNDGEN